MSSLAVDTANLVIAYNQLESMINDFDRYEGWKRERIYKYCDILYENRESLDEWGQKKYDELMHLYRRMTKMVEEIRQKATTLKGQGIVGAAIERALNVNVNMTLASRIPHA